MPGGELPGTEQSGTQGEGNLPGEQSQPTWDTQPPGGAAGGEQTAGQPPGGSPGGDDSWESGTPGSGDWQTSNQVPGEASSIPPMPSEQGGQPGDPAGGNPADGDLDKALKDFDGGILAEREVIRQRTNETAGRSGVPAELPGSEPSGDETRSEDGTPGYKPQGIPSETTAQKAPPMGGATAQVPDDIPDARDDDIIARQLREAAMNETDPELREKLWEEYRRYKGA
jgi:hypothetical protein